MTCTGFNTKSKGTRKFGEHADIKFYKESSREKRCQIWKWKKPRTELEILSSNQNTRLYHHSNR